MRASFDSLYAQMPGWAVLDNALHRNLNRHGDLPKWLRAVQRLPVMLDPAVELGDTVTVAGRLPSQDNRQQARIFRQLAAADASPFSTASRAPSGGPDVPSSTPATPSGPHHQAERHLKVLVEPSAGEREGDTPRIKTDSAGEREGASPAGKEVDEPSGLDDCLQALHPWRKGPFSLCGVHIDSEWRCADKWGRIAPHLDLAGKRVLDVGCGNGYYGWRMLNTGAELVIGIDPSVLYCIQHQAVNHFIGDARNQVLPLALEELPQALSAASFDAVFSMGVIYHRRDPREHLRQLRHCLVPGGQVVVEGLVVEGSQSLIPNGRYARMRNVWHIPTPAELLHWLQACGFQNPRILDCSTTTTAEQRSTQWMRFHSLADALDPANPSLTIEGHPAPRRALVLAHR